MPVKSGLSFAIIALVCISPAATLAAQVAPPAPPLLDLACASQRKVVEASGEIVVKYALTVVRDRKATVAVCPGEKQAVPIAWKVTDTEGKVVAEMPAGQAGPSILLDGARATTMGVYGEAKIKPAEKWPEGTLRVEATYTATADMYAKGAEGAFVGTLASKPFDIVVKPDGWKEETYRKYSSALERMLKARLRPKAFEFPELRKLENVTVTLSPDGAVGRFKLEREYLDIDDKKQTARLRKAEGFLEFVARDPWSPRQSAPDTQGLVEDGLVSVEFRYQMGSNKWLTSALPPIEEAILQDLRAKGAAAAESYEVPPELLMPEREPVSTEDLLRQEPQRLPQFE